MAKILGEVFVPAIEKKEDVLIPENLRIEDVITYLKSLFYKLDSDNFNNKMPMVLCNGKTGEIYDVMKKISETSITNGTKLILI